MHALLILICLLFVEPVFAESSYKLRISDGADPYIIDLIKLLLSYDSQPYELQHVASIPTQTRAIRLLGKKHGIDIFWSVSSIEREKQALAIRIPLVKGILGYRLGVVRKSNVARILAQIENGSLRELKFGLRADWPDHDVFVDNGYKVTSFVQEQSAYEMLAAGRFDVLPIDILATKQIEYYPDLMIDPHHIYYYPSAVYFFVHNQDLPLYKKLHSGFTQAMADGKFDSLFKQYFAEHLDQVNLRGRKRIVLQNAFLPASAPLNTKKYWYQNNKGN